MEQVIHGHEYDERLYMRVLKCWHFDWAYICQSIEKQMMDYCFVYFVLCWRKNRT